MGAQRRLRSRHRRNTLRFDNIIIMLYVWPISMFGNNNIIHCRFVSRPSRGFLQQVVDSDNGRSNDTASCILLLLNVSNGKPYYEALS